MDRLLEIYLAHKDWIDLIKDLIFFAGAYIFLHGAYVVFKILKNKRFSDTALAIEKNLHFILTGSQQFGLISGILQSLAGRTAKLSLLPFSLPFQILFLQKDHHKAGGGNFRARDFSAAQFFDFSKTVDFILQPVRSSGANIMNGF